MIIENLGRNELIDFLINNDMKIDSEKYSRSTQRAFYNVFTKDELLEILQVIE